MSRWTSLFGIAALLCQLAGCGGGNDVDEISVDADAANEPVEAIAVPDDSWPWWRGPNRDGTLETSSIPTAWSETEHVVWTAPVPGRGHSSPTVVGDRIFLATADDAREQQMVVCFDRASGRQLWQKTLLEGNFPTSGMHNKNTHATATVACDGNRLFVAFLNNGVITACGLSLDGELVWQTELGAFSPKFGYAPSPALHGPLAIFACDNSGGGFLAAVHRKTGNIVWRKQRPSVATYSSPVIAPVADGHQLLISGADLVSAYDPDSGDLLWSTKGTTEATCGTMVWWNNLVFASGGYPGRETICVRADQDGEVVWRNKVKCYEQSMLVRDGYLYAVDDTGIVYCWNCETGEEQWKARSKGPVSASLVAAGDRILSTSEDGTTFVFRADPGGFELLATNRLGTEAFATPSITGDRLYHRVADRTGEQRQETLYAIGEVE